MVIGSADEVQGAVGDRDVEALPQVDRAPTGFRGRAAG
jgi:hypothetical protein